MLTLIILAMAELRALLILVVLRKKYDIDVVIAVLTTVLGLAAATIGWIANEAALKFINRFLEQKLIAFPGLCAFFLVFGYAVAELHTAQKTKKV